jgi:hypothetical protein
MIPQNLRFYREQMVAMLVEFFTNRLVQQDGVVEDANVHVTCPRDDGAVAYTTQKSTVGDYVRYIVTAKDSVDEEEHRLENESTTSDVACCALRRMGAVQIRTFGEIIRKGVHRAAELLVFAKHR